MNALQTAFRFHLQTAQARYNDNRSRAVTALERARRDVASGKERYPAPIRGHKMRAGHDQDKPGSVYVENPESFGLRLVGRVATECGGRNGYWDSRGDSGWYDNPFQEAFKDGSGLIYGLVYQLPARKGLSRFVAAYQTGENDSGALIDFGTVHSSEPGGTWGSAQDDDAARDAARAADGMAEKAAESEREYKTAWEAGSDYAQEAEKITDYRKEALRLLAERRAARDKLDSASFPTLCAAIREKVRDQIDAISEARAKRSALAEGDHGTLIFWPGEKRLQDAFCEGAGLDSFPA